MNDAMQPDLETLVAYVQGTLEEADASAVARWLYTGASEEELLLYGRLVEERERARELLAKAAAQPARARLVRVLRRMVKGAAAMVGTLEMASRAPALAALSGTRSDELVLELPAGTLIDLELRLLTGGHYAVFALESDGRLHALSRGRAEAGARIELPAFELERGDDEVELVALVDPAAEPPSAPDNATADWLLTALKALPPTTRVLQRTVRRARPPFAHGG